MDACGGDPHAAAALLEDMAPRSHDGSAAAHLSERHNPVPSLYANASEIAALRAAAPQAGELPASLLHSRREAEGGRHGSGSRQSSGRHVRMRRPRDEQARSADSSAAYGMSEGHQACADALAAGVDLAGCDITSEDRKIASYLAQQDIYWVHRQEAVQMTHEWQKLFRRCAAGLCRGLLSQRCVSLFTSACMYATLGGMMFRIVHVPGALYSGTVLHGWRDACS